MLTISKQDIEKMIEKEVDKQLKEILANRKDLADLVEALQEADSQSNGDRTDDDQAIMTIVETDEDGNQATVPIRAGEGQTKD